MHTERLMRAIRDVPDFPKPGIVFKDITPVLLDPDLFREAVALFVTRLRALGVDKVAAIESRGFLFGAAAAYELGLGIVPVRKAGKLPYRTRQASYDLEYGSATLEIHEDAFQPGERVVLIDDLLATGGTARAAAGLVEELGGVVVECQVLIELAFLPGRQALSGYDLFAPIVYT